MKILHTSDWHIGKLVHQLHMTQEQDFLLTQLIEKLREERPDVLIIAGDLYDRSIPPVEAVELLDRIFSTIIIQLEIPILAIAGNHDSPDRLSFGSKLLEDRGLHLTGRLVLPIQPVVLKDQWGPVNFYLIPYAEPALVRALMQDASILTHNDAMKAILDEIKGKMNPNERHVVVAHGFVIGGENPEISDSERPLSIGGTEYIDVKHFEPFHYTALGHLHGPQRVQWEKVRYAGSLMKYSFSEAHQRKSMTLVEMDGQGEISLSTLCLKPQRDMRKIQGSLQQLLDPQVYESVNREDYLMVTLTDAGELIDPLGKLREVYPNVLRLERSALPQMSHGSKVSAGADHQKKTKLELFHQFYEQVTGLVFDEEKAALVKDALAQVESRERSR